MASKKQKASKRKVVTPEQRLAEIDDTSATVLGDHLAGKHSKDKGDTPLDLDAAISVEVDAANQRIAEAAAVKTAPCPSCSELMEIGDESEDERCCGKCAAKANLKVGKVYVGNDGKSYVVIAVNASSVVAKHDKKKIPFPRSMFEVLVGITSEDDYKKEQEERRLERKRKAEVTANTPKEQRVTTMSVIRTTLANNLEATVEEVAAACRAAGVPAKSESTIKTIMSDFKQTYRALLDADRIIID